MIHEYTFYFFHFEDILMLETFEDILIDNHTTYLYNEYTNTIKGSNRHYPVHFLRQYGLIANPHEVEMVRLLLQLAL